MFSSQSHFFTAILRDGLHVAAGHVLPQLPQSRGTSGTAFEVVVVLHGAKPDLPQHNGKRQENTHRHCIDI